MQVLKRHNKLWKKVNKSCFSVARKFLRQTTLDKIDEGNHFNNETFFSVVNDRIKYKRSKIKLLWP